LRSIKARQLNARRKLDEPSRHPRPPKPDPRPDFLTGPTAVGKSEIALVLAEISGEIISVDSMQVYRGLDSAAPNRPPPNAPACRIT
jgi:hypothetical protein